MSLREAVNRCHDLSLIKDDLSSNLNYKIINDKMIDDKKKIRTRKELLEIMIGWNYINPEKDLDAYGCIIVNEAVNRVLYKPRNANGSYLRAVLRNM